MKKKLNCDRDETTQFATVLIKFSPHNVHLTLVWFLHYKLGSSFLLWHFLAEPPEVFCVMGWVGGGRSSHPLALLYEGAVRGQVVLAGREGGGGTGGEGWLGGVGCEAPCCLMLFRFQPESNKANKQNYYKLITPGCSKTLRKDIVTWAMLWRRSCRGSPSQSPCRTWGSVRRSGWGNHMEGLGWPG